jgi:hypothetical protein
MSTWQELIEELRIFYEAVQSFIDTILPRGLIEEGG